jgi:hypothetical protein
MTPAHAAPLAPLPLARLTIPGRIRQIWGGKFDDRAAYPAAYPGDAFCKMAAALAAQALRPGTSARIYATPADLAEILAQISFDTCPNYGRDHLAHPSTPADRKDRRALATLRRHASRAAAK